MKSSYGMAVKSPQLHLDATVSSLIENMLGWEGVLLSQFVLNVNLGQALKFLDVSTLF